MHAPRAATWPTLLMGGLLAAASCLALGCDGPAAGPPNVVLIIGDDLGYGDYGFMGSGVALTPNLDRLARESFVFTHGFSTSSSCRPSLASLLTGLHPEQMERRLPPASARGSEPAVQRIRHFETVPSLLAERGYSSFQGGKFWEGTHADAGFSDGTSLPAPEPTSEGTRMVIASGGAGLALGRETMDPIWRFLSAHGNRPYYLQFAPMLPHVPHDPPDRLMTPYRGVVPDEPAIRYFGNVSRFDEVVGELVDRLDARGDAANTIVIYVGDNGWEQDDGTNPWGGPRGKLSLYELGWRTPALVRWPGKIQPGRSDALISTTDLVGLVLESANARLPEGFEGLSLLAPLTGEGEIVGRPEIVGTLRGARPWPDSTTDNDVRTGRPGAFIRTPQWAYLWRPTAEEASRSDSMWLTTANDRLFDMVQDPDQTEDLSSEHLDVVIELRSRVMAWKRKMNPRRPRFQFPMESTLGFRDPREH